MNLVAPLMRQMATLAFLPDQPPPSEKETQRVRAVLEGLRQGRIDRTQFTANANAYFSQTALRDLKASLGGLGKLQAVTLSGDNLRGGMAHRSYRAQFAKKTMTLNIYVVADGRFEQFLVEEQL